MKQTFGHMLTVFQFFLQVGTTSLRDCSVDLRGTRPQPSITIFPLLIETERHPLASMATVFAEMTKLPRILNLSNVTMKLVTGSVGRHMVTLPSGLTFMLTPGSHVHVPVFKCYPTESATRLQELKQHSPCNPLSVPSFVARQQLMKNFFKCRDPPERSTETAHKSEFMAAG